MIRSLRVTSVIAWKSCRKRRWMPPLSATSSLIPPKQTSFQASFSGIVSSYRNAAIPGNYYVSRNNDVPSQPIGLFFFSTNCKRDPNNNESEHDAPTQKPQTIRDQLKSIPNILTISRLASTPLLCYWIINDEPYLAIVGCFFAGASDVLDGYIAKNYGQKTVLGTYLDPFADKFFINSLAISLCYSGILPMPLILLWASKDVLLLGGMGWYLYQEQNTFNFFSNSIHSKPLTVTPSTLGKANTGLQFATLAAGILTPVVPPDVLQPTILESLCWMTGASSIVTTISYARGGKGFTYTAKNNQNVKKRAAADANSANGNNDT